MPGAPSSAVTARPESSASAGSVAPSAAARSRHAHHARSGRHGGAAVKAGLVVDQKNQTRADEDGQHKKNPGYKHHGSFAHGMSPTKEPKSGGTIVGKAGMVNATWIRVECQFARILSECGPGYISPDMTDMGRSRPGSDFPDTGHLRTPDGADSEAVSRQATMPLRTGLLKLITAGEGPPTSKDHVGKSF